MIGASQKLV